MRELKLLATDRLGWRRSIHTGEAGMPSRTTPRGEQHSSTPCLSVGCWSPMDCAWFSNCGPHSTRHSGLPQTCSALGTPWNILGATMAPLCSCTGLVGPVPKVRWRLSWTNHRYGWKLESPLRRDANQMNGSIPVLLVQRKCDLQNVLGRWCWLWCMSMMG